MQIKDIKKLPVKDILEIFDIMSISQASAISNEKATTIKSRCQAGKYDAVCIGKMWLLKFSKENA